MNVPGSYVVYCVIMIVISVICTVIRLRSYVDHTRAKDPEGSIYDHILRILVAAMYRTSQYK